MASRASFLSKAYAAARRAGLPDPAARVAASQAALESNYGKSAPGNNFFGIKAGSSWKGATQKLKTWEVVAGKKVTIKDSFRKYEDFAQSFKDWAKLIEKRWPEVLKAQTFEEAAAALKAGLPGGYATDPNYASKLAAMNARMGDQLGATLPDEMQAPQFREQALSQAANQEAIAKAFRDPMRALDVVPSKLNAPALASQYAQYQRGTVPAAPSVPSTPTSGVYRDMIDTAQWSPAGFARPALANEAISRALSAPSMPTGLSRPAPPTTSRQVASMPVGLSRPSPPSISPSLAKAAGTPTSGYNAKAQAAGTPTQGYEPTGPSAASLAANYGQYRTPTNYTNVRTAMQAAQPQAPASMPGSVNVSDLEKALSVRNELENIKDMSLGTPTAVAPPSMPPAIAAPPAAVLAPALVQRPAVNDYPVASIPAAPKAKAYDVYSGMAETAMDNTGTNTIGRLQDGTTTVTNKYGVTTGMTPYGKQTAVGSLPGISAPDMGKFGQSVKGAVPTVAGAAAGGLLAGPLGALLGGLIAKEATKPGGLLNRQSFQTDYYGTINAAKAQGGGNFPSAPSGGYGNKSASFSNRSAEGMRSISPGAAAAIGAGKGGLY